MCQRMPAVSIWFIPYRLSGNKLKIYPMHVDDCSWLYDRIQWKYWKHDCALGKTAVGPTINWCRWRWVQKKCAPCSGCCYHFCIKLVMDGKEDAFFQDYLMEDGVSNPILLTFLLLRQLFHVDFSLAVVTGYIAQTMHQFRQQQFVVLGIMNCHLSIGCSIWPDIIVDKFQYSSSKTTLLDVLCMHWSASYSLIP